MRELGDYLRKIREEKNISLKDIQEATKIRSRYLEAIEAGDFSVIPGEVYLKGFLTNYALAIGLDGKEVLQRYYQLKKMKIEQAESDIAQIAASAPVQSNPFLKINLDFSAEWFKGIYLGIATALFIMLIIILFLLPAMREGDSRGINSTATKSVETESNTTNLHWPITVEAIFSEAVWVKVVSDGQDLYSGGHVFDSTSSRLTWSAQKEMQITVGNAAGLQMVINGKQYKTIGAEGERKTLNLTPNGLMSTAP